MMSADNYPEIGTDPKVLAPKPGYVRMPRKGQADRKALSRAFNEAKKEQVRKDKELNDCECSGCGG